MKLKTRVFELYKGKYESLSELARVMGISRGQIFPVRKETVIKLGNLSKEILDLLLYSLRSPKNILYLPWEEENEEEFKKRAEYFGLKISTN